MYSVYNSSIYNDFLKKERKKRNLTTKDLSKLLYMSVGSINYFENSDDILNNEQISYFLNFYGYNSDYLNNFDTKLNNFFTMFVHSAIFIDDKSIEKHYMDLSRLFSDLEGTPLFTAFSLCNLIYSMYLDTSPDTDNIDFLKKNMTYFKDKYQSLANIYLGMYYLKKDEYNKSKTYFDFAQFNLTKDDTFQDMYHYFISNYYMKVNDLFSSYKHRENAITLFGKNNNYQRILNTSIQLGTQYIYLGNYKKAISIYEETLLQAKDKNFKYEKNVLIYNLAFVYMLQGKYNIALDLYTEIFDVLSIPSECYSFMICLVENGRIDTAKEVCKKGINLNNTPFYQYFFEIYNEYFENKNLMRLTRKINHGLKKFKSNISILEQQFLHILIANQYKKLRKYKKSTDHLEKYIDLLTNSN